MASSYAVHVQNIVHEVRACVSSRMVMRGGNASVRGQVLRNCWHGVCIAASFTWEGEGCAFWIGTADLDRLFSYPQRHNLSSSWFPIHFVAACAHTRPHVGPMICTWALSSARGQRRLRAGYGVYVRVKGLTCSP